MEGDKEVKYSFISKKWRRFNYEHKRDNDEINRVQDLEWKRAVEFNEKSSEQEDVWTKKKEEKSLVQINNPPFLLFLLRRIFTFLFLFSVSKWIAGTKKHKTMIRNNDFSPYRNIEKYVIGCLVFESITFIYLFIVDAVLHRFIGSVELVVFYVLIFPFCYRLFDIFQSWIGQFILRSKWNALNVNRSLVLNIIGYIEITLIFVTIRFILQRPISIGKSLYLSVMAMIANPADKVGSLILYTQIMFAILFIVVVAQHVIGRLSGNDEEKKQ